MKHLLAQLRDTKIKFSEEQLKTIEKLIRDNQAEAANRFSIKSFFTPLIATFGFVTTLYGFEKILDQTALIDQPWLMLGIGVLILLVTGVYYQKLQ